MKRFVIGALTLMVITAVNFWFYSAFKPHEVILNRLFGIILENPGSDFTPENVYEYVFYNSFGDFLAVFMMLIVLSLLMRLIAFDPPLWLYRFTLVMFLAFEAMQVIMPGNFKWVDIMAYVLAYFLAMPFIAWLDEKPLKGYF
ncbi:MAG: hypothetical protein ACQEQA_05180 [Bacillota bacterium]